MIYKTLYNIVTNLVVLLFDFGPNKTTAAALVYYYCCAYTMYMQHNITFVRHKENFSPVILYIIRESKSSPT